MYCSTAVLTVRLVSIQAGVKGTSRDSYGRLVLGDIIIGADGKKIKTAADLYRALDKCKVGQNVDLELLRQDSKEHVQVWLIPGAQHSLVYRSITSCTTASSQQELALILSTCVLGRSLCVQLMVVSPAPKGSR